MSFCLCHFCLAKTFLIKLGYTAGYRWWSDSSFYAIILSYCLKIKWAQEVLIWLYWVRQLEPKILCLIILNFSSETAVFSAETFTISIFLPEDWSWQYGVDNLFNTMANYFLWIFQAQLEDSGPYMCQLNTDPMKSKMGILNVIIRPDIIEVTGSRVVTEGGNVR